MRQQPKGTVRAEITGYGQYETTGESLDRVIDVYWGRSPAALGEEIRERVGDPTYNTEGLSKIELMLILAELSGFATN